MIPTLYETLHVRVCLSSEYDSLDSYDNNSIYFLTDTCQVFVGDAEYTKSCVIRPSRPDESEQGEEGRIYICQEDGSSFTYIDGQWVAIYDSTLPTVKYVRAGEGIVCSPNPITTDGTVSHDTPEGASELVPDVSEVNLKLGDSFTLNEVNTDKFGHVTGLSQRTVNMPSADELATVFKFKGTVTDRNNLPQTGNVVGDVYYVTEDSAEYVYLESGWEKLGPVVDLSGLVEKVPESSGYVAMISDTGSVTSAGYKPQSGVTPGTYGQFENNLLSVPRVVVDEFGRTTLAQNVDVSLVDAYTASDYVAWYLEKSFL